MYSGGRSEMYRRSSDLCQWVALSWYASSSFHHCHLKRHHCPHPTGCNVNNHQWVALPWYTSSAQLSSHHHLCDHHVTTIIIFISIIDDYCHKQHHHRPHPIDRRVNIILWKHKTINGIQNFNATLQVEGRSIASSQCNNRWTFLFIFFPLRVDHSLWFRPF